MIEEKAGIANRVAKWHGLIAYQSLSLAMVGIVLATALAMGNDVTSKLIEKGQLQDLQTSLAQVLPSGSFDNDLTKSSRQVGERKVYLAYKSGQLVAVVFGVESRGYAGPVKLIMGVNSQGKVLGVRVLSHAETPGLGDKIEPEKSNWLEAFTGKTLSSAKWAVKKDGGEFDQFAGATITPRAVVKAVHEGLQWFDSQKPAILKGDAK